MDYYWSVWSVEKKSELKQSQVVHKFPHCCKRGKIWSTKEFKVIIVRLGEDGVRKTETGTTQNLTKKRGGHKNGKETKRLGKSGKPGYSWVFLYYTSACLPWVLACHLTMHLSNDICFILEDFHCWCDILQELMAHKGIHSQVLYHKKTRGIYHLHPIYKRTAGDHPIEHGQDSRMNLSFPTTQPWRKNNL